MYILAIPLFFKTGSFAVLCWDHLRSEKKKKKKKKKKKNSRHSLYSMLFWMRVEHRMRLFVIEILFTSEPLFK